MYRYKRDSSTNGDLAAFLSVACIALTAIAMGASGYLARSSDNVGAFLIMAVSAVAAVAAFATAQSLWRGCDDEEAKRPMPRRDVVVRVSWRDRD